MNSNDESAKYTEENAAISMSALLVNITSNSGNSGWLHNEGPNTDAAPSRTIVSLDKLDKFFTWSKVTPALSVFNLALLAAQDCGMS